MPAAAVAAYAQAAAAAEAAIPAAAEPGQPRAATVRRHHAKGDPLEGFNRVMFAIHQFLDRIFFRPAAFTYKAIVPKLLRRGISHIFSNIEEPIVFVNDVLQLRPKKAAETMARFIINSTAGVGGILDVAKTAELPHRDNGFANTMAIYGIGPGPYLFIPFFGPGNFRDLPGGQIDALVLQLGVRFPFTTLAYVVPSTVLPGLDLRMESDEALKALLSGAADPYATLRSVYTQNRAAEVAALRGEPTESVLDDPLLDPEAPAGASAPPATETPPADAVTGTPDSTGTIDPVTTPPPAVVPATPAPQAAEIAAVDTPLLCS